MATEDKILQEDALQAVPPFERATPGQSLTNDPDSPMPFEGPPEFSSIQEALGFLLNNILEERAIKNIVRSLSGGIPVSELAYMIIYDGFRRGHWNPDLMMLLAEPVMYILLYIAERADIGNIKIYTDEENEGYDDLEGGDKLKAIGSTRSALRERGQLNTIDRRIPDIEAALPSNVQQQLEEELPSLLQRPVEEGE